ncbi:Putative transcriptional regulator [Acinetobacter baumannii]|nr:Putative transcriptional regulator [Acinetobacter baumannii]
MEYVHKACGHKFRPTMVCPECGEPVGSRDVTAVPGPGFAAMAGKLAQN